MAQNQNAVSTERTDYTPAQIKTSIIKEFRDYDRWELNDIQRLSESATLVLTSVSSASPQDLHQIIPQQIVARYGDDAPRIFMNEVYKRFDALNLENAVIDGKLRATIRSEASLTREQMDALVLDRPYTMRLTDGSLFTTTPILAVEHTLNRAIMNPAAPPANPYAVEVAIPNSVLDAIIASNPSVARELETLRGKPILSASSGSAYALGQVAQMRGKNNIEDWSMRVDDPQRICPEIVAIERDVYSGRIHAARVDESWIAGNSRATETCPTVLGALSAPAMPPREQMQPQLKRAS